jgi:predicted amidohydrolase
MKGGVDKNLEADLVNEFLNREFKGMSSSFCRIIRIVLYLNKQVISYRSCYLFEGSRIGPRRKIFLYSLNCTNDHLE